jgi:Tfp pilus assembly protein PilN
MQEINLLQNKVKDKTLSWERRNRVIVTLFTLILILEILVGVGLYVLTQTTKGQIKDVQAKNQTIQNALDSNQKDLAAAKGLQAELKNLKVLLNNHVYWSQFFNKLAALTPKKTAFSTVSASSTDGKVRLNGIAPSYIDIGKLILSLSTSDSFSSAKLTTVAPTTGKTFGYDFVVEVKASPKLFIKQ